MIAPTVPGPDSLQNGWRLARHDRMRVDARLYGEAEAELQRKDALVQLCNAAALPGVVDPVRALPHLQAGYGFPVGTVAAFDARAGGVIVPGGIGYDINCGIRLLRSEIDAAGLQPLLPELLRELETLARRTPQRLTLDEVCAVLTHGAGWAVAHGYGIPADVDMLEWRGTMPGASAAAVSDRALRRGSSQLGTLGGGDHFIEFVSVARVLDADAAALLGLEEGRVAVLVHSGSRGLGCEVCAEGIELMQHAAERYRINLPDRQLACAPLLSEEGRCFFGAMAAAANFAFANRQVLTHCVRAVLARVLRTPLEATGLTVACDVAHNLATWEDRVVDGRTLRWCVHRRGASRALPAGTPTLPLPLRTIGQPVVLAGGEGERSTVLLPGPAATGTLDSLPHGCGRAPALAHSPSEGQPGGERMAQLLEQAGLARTVAVLRPLGGVRAAAAGG